MTEPQTQSIIIYQNQLYRTAGYRPPNEGDTYVAKDGKVKFCYKKGVTFDSARLILQPLQVIYSERTSK